MQEDNAAEILRNIFNIKTPLKRLILEYIPKNFQLKLCKSSRATQDQFNLTFNTYKYYSLLRRRVPLEQKAALKNLCAHLTFHHIDIPFNQMNDALLFTRVNDFTKKNVTVRVSELHKAIEIFLLDYHVPYLFLSTSAEFDLFKKFEMYFKETQLLIKIDSYGKDLLDTMLNKNKAMASNIIYIESNIPSYCNYDYPNLRFLSLLNNFSQKEESNFNYLSKKLDWAKIFLSAKSKLNPLDLSNMKHLSIELGSNPPIDILELFNTNLFNELVSLKIISENKQNMPQEPQTIRLSLSRLRYPNLKHLQVRMIQILSIDYEDIKLESLVLTGRIVALNRLPVSTNLTLLCAKGCIEPVIDVREGQYNFTKLKLGSLFPLQDVVIANLNHLTLVVTDADKENLKPFFEVIRMKLVSLTVDFTRVTDTGAIANVLFAEFPNVKKLSINFLNEYESSIFSKMKKYLPLNNMTHIKLRFHVDCPTSESKGVIDGLLKYPLPVLESLSCFNIHEAVMSIMRKSIPSLKKLEIFLKISNEDVFDNFDDIFTFFKNPHPKLECLIISNRRFNSFVNYSLRKYRNLYSYRFDTQKDGMLVHSPCIVKNSIFDDSSCFIF